MKRKYTDKDTAEIRHLYCDEDLPYREVAERLGFPASTVEGIGLRYGFSHGSPNRRKYTDKDIAEIRHLYCDEDLPYREVAERLGFPGSTVRKIGLRYGFPHGRPNPRKYTDKDIAEIRHLYGDEGLSYRQVAVRLGFPDSTVAAIGCKYSFSRHTSNRKPPRKYSDGDIATIRHLYCDEGLSYRQVAERLGFPKGSVETIGHRVGCKRVYKWDGKFNCRVCGKRKSLNELVKDRRYSPFPGYCCCECYMSVLS